MSDVKELIKNKIQATPFSGKGSLQALLKSGLQVLDQEGIPTVKHEEWKYTRIAGVLNKAYHYAVEATGLSRSDVDSVRLPGHESANELVFVNGVYHAELSKVLSPKDELDILPLSEAVKGEYKTLVDLHLGHSAK
ncbi:MAG: Fe-S cluster assembly protein SufD, partial [Bacteroidota bacterium]